MLTLLAMETCGTKRRRSAETPAANFRGRDNAGWMRQQLRRLNFCVLVTLKALALPILSSPTLVNLFVLVCPMEGQESQNIQQDQDMLVERQVLAYLHSDESVTGDGEF
jgi:hypothetical protein